MILAKPKLDHHQGSRWWNDIHKVNGNATKNGQWLSKGFKKMLGDGSSITFWLKTWVGDCKPCNQFSRLFRLLAFEECNMYKQGMWTDSNGDVLLNGEEIYMILNHFDT
ncbi:hypothetical protein Ancab_010969 [Ancistrocladus abbreviatus]